MSRCGRAARALLGLCGAPGWASVRASLSALSLRAQGSCVYHKEAPIFHEGAKKWVCCGATKYDFDDFINVPGCSVGKHEPVEYDDDPVGVS